MDKKNKLGAPYNPQVKVTPLTQNGDMPVDWYSWGDPSNIGIYTKKEQVEEALDKAFGSINIKEDEETPESDYVLKVLGRDAGRVVIPYDKVIKRAYYDKENKQIVLVVATEEGGEDEIRIDVSDLIDVYTGDEVTIHIEKNVISITEAVMNKFTELQTADESLQAAINTESERAKGVEATKLNITDVESIPDATIKALFD